MPRRLALLTLLCLPVFAAQASAHERAPGGKELEKAEAVLSKLRRLEAAAAPDAPGAFEKAARKLYPGLFESVSELLDGDLKTDLSTAVTLYESALRATGTADCARELRDAYARLCHEAGGDRARLLRAKARLHAGRAEAALLYARGARDRVTLDALNLIRAERATDRALADEALLQLKALAAALGGGRDGSASETLPVRLEQLDRLLASLPRDRTAALLREARTAFRDGLYWRLKAAPARALVVNVNSFDATPPGTLPRLGLRTEDAERAAHANFRAALKFIDRAEEVLGRTNEGR
ncbi:MAG TPA: hypothetical protein VFZ44_10905 [Pyrinomonadaceae bacterium]